VIARAPRRPAAMLIAACVALVICFAVPAAAQREGAVLPEELKPGDTSERAIEMSIAKLRSPDASRRGNELMRLTAQGAAAGPVFIAIYQRAPDLGSLLLQRACIPGKTGEAGLALVDSLGPDALEPMVQLALESNGWPDCVLVLQHIGVDASGSRLLTELQDPSSTHRERAMYLLAQLHDMRALAPLRRLLNSPQPKERAAAAYALQDLNAIDAVDDLIHMLQDPSPGMRFAALNSLAHIKSDRARDAVLAYLKNNQETKAQRSEITRSLSSNLDPQIRATAMQSAPWFDTENWIPGQWLLFYVAVANVIVVGFSVLSSIAFRIVFGATPQHRQAQLMFWAVVGLFPAWYGFTASRVGSIFVGAFAIGVVLSLLACAGLIATIGKRAVPVRDAVLVVTGALFGGYVLGIVVSLMSPVRFGG
jgi:hypothetical protein